VAVQVRVVVLSVVVPKAVVLVQVVRAVDRELKVRTAIKARKCIMDSLLL
jgi:hypothetical protein